MTADGFEVLPAFLLHVANQPNATAIETLKEEISYARLDSWANGLVKLFERNGLAPRSIVALVLPRGPDLVAAELAALKMGACFLPIDPDQPAARIAAILRQSRASFYLTSRSLAERTASLPGRAVFVQDASAEAGCTRRRVSDADLAYVIFTSGSTGTPKGVMITRRSMNHFCREWIARTGLGPGEKSTFLASPGFDTSIDEIWPALASGAALSVPDDDSRFSPALLAAWIDAKKVTVCDAPTAVAELLLERRWAGTSLKVLVAGGDRLTKYPPADLPFRFLNAYGPTEHTVVSTIEEMSCSASTTSPAIGFPISETEIYIVDENFGLLPPGKIGEIIISGPGLARGYLNAPDQTADKFVPNPFSALPGARCYRTGDAGSKDAEGRVFFHGRTDSQLSIRGNRVEPGEVSAAFKKHPNVDDAFVTVLNKSEHSAEAALVVYYVPKDRTYTPTKKELSDHAKTLLPAYMIPDHFVVVGALPLNMNGKVDPKLLPTPSVLSRRSKRVKPPANHAQTEILSIWKRVLGLEQIGVDENFFDLGGNSLAAIRIVAGLSAVFGNSISLKQFYQSPTIESLDASRHSWSSVPAPSIVPTAPSHSHQLSFQQEQVVFFQSLAPSSNAYNSQSTIRIRGAFDTRILVEALNAITRRHELLRTTYSHVGSEFVQVVHDHFRVEVPLFDLSHSAEQRVERDMLIESLLGTVFDLSRLPLAQWVLIKLSDEEHDLVLIEHHIVHDGWTLSIIFRELQEYYSAISESRPARLPELPIQYRDFAAWQRNHIEGEYFSRQLAYWKKELEGAPRTTLVPFDFPRPKKQTFRGELISLDIPEHLSTRMKEFARANRFTFFEVMFSVFSLLVHRVSRQDDVCIGSALANRERPEAAGLIGMFVNVVVIRSILKQKQRFADYVRMINGKIVEANMNQAYPFPKLIQKLNLPRDSAANPLFQVMFSFHDSDVLDPTLGDANCYIDHLHGNGSAKQDLDVVVIPRGRRNRGNDSEADERIAMIWEFNRDLFARATVQRLIEQYLQVLEACLADGDLVAEEVDILPREQASRIAEYSALAPPRWVDVLSRINEQLEARPDQVCVVAEETAGCARYYRYRELQGKACEIRRKIEESGGVGDEPLTAIVLPRGFLQIASQLAVLQSGRAFVPIDPANPIGRIKALLKEARVSSVIVGVEQQEIVPPNIPTILVSCAAASGAPGVLTPATERSPHSLAYVIFTSGSTGTPKGVAVSTEALYGYVARNIADFSIDGHSRVLVYNSPGFDTSLSDIWPALAAGATLFVPREEVRYSADELIQYICVNQITFADVPTAMGERMIARPWPAAHWLETLLVGGEKLQTRPLASHSFRLFNEYGPTEATISATSGIVAASDAASPPDIGTPIAGRGCLVLDSNLRMVPIGVEGDLYVFGNGLARGYWGDPALTAERFLPNPFDARGGRMYRTGDVAKWTAEGTLQFCGRRDRQVKIHGFRIELEEISARVREVHGVVAAHTLTKELPSGKREIVAFYVANDGSESAIRSHLRECLPAYMMPGKFASVLKIPVTLGGKVDEKGLLACLENEVSSLPRGTPSAHPAHQRLQRIWCALLKVESVGLDQNFFELGGHSLLLAELQRSIDLEFRVKIPLVEFFEFSRIESLAARIESISEPRTEDAKTEGRAPKENLLRRRSTTMRPGR